MSDNWINIVPNIPDYIPTSQNAQDAILILKHLSPEADEIAIVEHEHIQFFDCGSNFEMIQCPECKSQIEFDWWGETMSSDFDENSGFHMKKYSLPCCLTNLSLNKLSYHFHQAFGRFALSVMNPNVGALSLEEIEKLEAALGCKISIVYQHL